MSYEGYEQLLCAKGHYHIVDCYDHKPNKCPAKGCKSKIVWQNSVDLTNGSRDDKGKRIDGFVELKIKSKKRCICEECGNEHNLEEPTFIIPKNKGAKI